MDFPGKELNSVHYLRGLDDAEKIKSNLEFSNNVVIIGAGYIGLEVAAIATEKGIAVTVVEMADRVMNRTVDPQISDYYQRLHENNGVSFKFNASLEEIRGDDKPDLDLCSDGTEIKADTVIIGAGIVPNVEIAEKSGITCNNGICVDEFGRTDVEDIFA